MATRVVTQIAGRVSLDGLPALVAAEIRYALWAHSRSARPSRWHPMWLRTFVRSCQRAAVGSLMELDCTDNRWAWQASHLNRILCDMQKEIGRVHRTRADTRSLGYLDADYWGFRFPDRRSPLDLGAIPQPWLRGLTWDYLAAQLDSPDHPRSHSPFEEARKAAVCFGVFLNDCMPGCGSDPAKLTESAVREFIADLKRTVADQRPLRGVYNLRGKQPVATSASYPRVVGALRKMMRWALDSGAADAAGLRREFVVAIPFGGAPPRRNPRPFTDEVLRALSDPANIAVLAEMDVNDIGLADIWSIQVRCGRRIGEVVKLRLDCVGEHLGRTWMWVDMTKVGKLDYAIQIPRDVYDVVRGRQVKTIERYRLRFGVDPTAKQRRSVALFPSKLNNPTFERSLSASRFGMRFREWLQSEQVNLPGHTSHQARHTLATRLVSAGASMAHVKRVLGHVSEHMSESYVLIAGSQVEPFLQRVWVTGPGNAEPGRVVLTPSDAERSTAENLLVDLAAVPIEHGLCTYKPVVGGFDCPFGRRCHTCEHFVITGADYAYWKRQEERWAVLAEGAPDATARDYIYGAFERSSQALAGLEKALIALGLIDKAKELDLRSPHQDFLRSGMDQGLARRGPGRNGGEPTRRRGLKCGTREGSVMTQTPTRPRPQRAIDARRRAVASKVDSVEKALKLLGRTGAPITRASVAKIAGVSRSFTYENDQARTSIAAAQTRANAGAQGRPETAIGEEEASWRARALNAEDEVRRLRQELATQRRLVSDLLGQARDPDGTWVAQERERLRSENDQLLAERNQLVQDRGDLQRRLQGARAQVSRLAGQKVVEMFPNGPGPASR